MICDFQAAPDHGAEPLKGVIELVDFHTK
jgi:hypothetical protein